MMEEKQVYRYVISDARGMPGFLLAKMHRLNEEKVDVRTYPGHGITEFRARTVCGRSVESWYTIIVGLPNWDAPRCKRCFKNIKDVSETPKDMEM